MLSTLLRLAPSAFLRWLKRRHDRSALVRRLVDPFSARLRGREVRIRHGAAAGLLISTEGGTVSYGIGTAEPLIQRTLQRHVRAGGTFYDIGANVGFFTLVGAQLVGERGHVVAFEPAPATAALLSANVARNGLDRVRLLDIALGDRTGEAHFAVMAENQYGRMAHLDDGSIATVEQIGVRVERLDALVDEGLPPPTIIKMDIEGAETEALRGMETTLREHHPVVLCELHGTQREVAAAFEAHGYTLRGLDDVRETEEPYRAGAPYSHLLALPT